MDSALQTIFSVFGVGGIVGGIITFRLNKSKELEFKRREQKEHRYKSSLLFMATYLENDLTYIESRPDIPSVEYAAIVLKAEYNDMLLYASKEAILAMRDFLNKPNEDTFYSAICAMRRDLWLKNNDLVDENLRIKLRKSTKPKSQ